MNVLLDPLQSEALVQQPCIGPTISQDFGAGKKAESPKTIVETDKNEFLAKIVARLLQNPRWFEGSDTRAVLGAENITASVNLLRIPS